MNTRAAIAFLVAQVPITGLVLWYAPMVLLGVAPMILGCWLLSHDADPGIVLAGREDQITGLGLACVGLGYAVMAAVFLAS